jgi:hypothetical protein
MTFQSLRDHQGGDPTSSVLDWAQTRTIRGARQADERSGAGGRAAGTAKKLLIVDWDDTIFPTTFMAQMGIAHNARPSDVPTVARDALRKYAYRVKETFKLLESHGRVVIVTNARAGWIELSCAHFLPEIESLVRSFRRISAQPPDISEGQELRPAEWKADAFVAIAQAHYGQDNTVGQPLFSLGDAMYEREAVHRTSERLGVVSQSVKLLDHPSLDVLAAEHASLQEDGYLEDLLRREDGFDLYFDVLDGPTPFNDCALFGRDELCGPCPETPHTGQKAPEALDLSRAPDTDTPKSTASTISTAASTTASTTPSGSTAPLAFPLVGDVSRSQLLSIRGRALKA